MLTKKEIKERIEELESSHRVGQEDEDWGWENPEATEYDVLKGVLKKGAGKK